MKNKISMKTTITIQNKFHQARIPILIQAKLISFPANRSMTKIKKFLKIQKNNKSKAKSKNQKSINPCNP